MSSEKIEKLEIRIKSLEKRVTNLEQTKRSKPSTTNSSKIQKLMVEKISNLKPQDLVILILHLNSKQSKDEIKTRFKALGATKKMLNWFNGGNFKQRLIDTGLIFDDGNDENNKIIYSLTEGKGTQKALEIIEKLESTN